MGVLWSKSTRRGKSLGPRTLIGRGPECTLRVDDPLVSANHASLTWREGRWLLRDLGSRNGTFLDGERVEPGSHRAVAEGATLRLGKTCTFKLLDGGKPGPVGVRQDTGEVQRATGGLLLLPDGESPEALIYEDEDWLIELGDAVEHLTEDRRLELVGSTWWVLLPVARAKAEVATTMEPGITTSVDTISLHFKVSPDEEHVELSVGINGQRVPLRSRVHQFMMLQLARVRLADREGGSPHAECGWVYAEDLAQQLQVSPPVLNVQLLRARQQLAEAEVEGVGRLFERRRLSGQLRIGVDQLTVDSS